MGNVDYFMYFYMIELEILLNSKKEDIYKIKFQSDEANTDRQLKEYIKNIIEKEFNRIPSTKINKLIIDDNSYMIDNFLNFKINKVFLQDELTDDIINEIKKVKTSVYKNPDICLEIESNGKIYYETIELKSTKNSVIQGSSVQQIIPNEWMIFIKHNKKDVDITTGKYIHSINTKIQFPDRSPRPQVSFDYLKSWNKSFRIVENGNLIYKNDNFLLDKLNLVYDWQSVLVERWLDILFKQDRLYKNEPWFNNALRKLIIDFLNIYDDLNDFEKENFKMKLKSLIKKES